MVLTILVAIDEGDSMVCVVPVDRELFANMN